MKILINWSRFALAALALSGTASFATAVELVIGQATPLLGVLASTGKQMVVGGKIYFDHVNAQGGVYGAQIRQDVADDCYKVVETVRLTREMLARSEVVALFGFAGTANVTQLLTDGVLDAGSAALVAPYTGGESLRNPFSPWIFHARAGYAAEAEHMVQQVTMLGMKRLAVMDRDDGFGKAGLLGVENALAKRSLKLAAAAGYERNTDKVESAVAAIKASDAQAIIMISVTKPSAAGRSCTTSRWLTRPNWSSWLAWKTSTGWASASWCPILFQPACRWYSNTRSFWQNSRRARPSTTPALRNLSAPRCWSKPCGAPALIRRVPRWSSRLSRWAALTPAASPLATRRSTASARALSRSRWSAALASC